LILVTRRGKQVLRIAEKANVRALAGLGLGLVAVVTAAGCGSSGSHSATSSSGKGGTGAILDAAYSNTVSAKTAEFHITEVVSAASSSGSSTHQTITGSGGVNFSDNSFTTTVNSPSGGTVTVLISGTTLYGQVPPADRPQVPGHKPWFSIDLNKLDQAKVGRSYSQLVSANQDNPASALSQLQSVSDRVIPAGSAAIGGASTTAYKATVDLDKVAAQVAAKDGQKAAAQVPQREQTLGAKSIPIEVWIGPGNRVYQYQTVVPVPPSSAGATNGSGTATLTMTLSDFGQPVDTTPPASSQVADVTSQAISQSGS
jgi:hypothetical protein